MGRDKASLELGAETMLQRTLRRLAGRNVTLVAKSRAEAPAGVRELFDASPDHAPIHGLAAALDDAAARGFEWALLLAVDLPFLRRRTIDRLEEIARDEAPDCRVVVPRADGFLQSLAAIYRPSIRTEIPSRIAAGRPSLHELVEAGPHRVVESAELGASAGEFRNVNTPEELQAAIRDLPAGGGDE